MHESPIQETAELLDSEEIELDQEIASLENQISILKSRRATLAFPLIQETSNALSIHANPPKSILERRKHALTSLYRTTASITSFTVHDPDPNAINKGKLVGLRIEAFAHRKFTRPYYIFLSQASAGTTSSLRIHRHTIPPAIPLASLAAKFLPQPKNGIAMKQDLGVFLRRLRGQLQAYHNRLASVGSLRDGLGVDEVRRLRDERGEDVEGVLDVSAIDAEAQQIRIEWADGGVGRVEIGTKGEIVRSVVTDMEGRDRERERDLMGGDGRVENLLERLSHVEGGV